MQGLQPPTNVFLIFNRFPKTLGSALLSLPKGQLLSHKVIIISDYLRNNAENNKQWQDLQLLQDKNLGYSYGNNPLDDSGLGGMIPNGMDESVQNVSRGKPEIHGRSCSW